MGHKKTLIQTLILTLALSIFAPVYTQANSHLSELKAKEKQNTWRIEYLQKDIQEQEQELGQILTERLSLNDSILKVTQELNANEQRIVELQKAIAEKEIVLGAMKESVAVLVRDLEVVERSSFLAKILNHNSLSEALSEVDQKQILLSQIGERHRAVIENTQSLAAARDQLEITKLALASSRVSLEIQHQALQIDEKQQRTTINSSQSLLRAAEQERADIKNQIFAAAFDATGKTINLAEAVHYATLAADRLKQTTGQEISVPLLLAIVKHESNFGSYVGKGHYRSAMCSQSQVEAFIFITTSLGLDPETTPVSKPAQYQNCGGAMGYAQFLPRTWLAYADKVAAVTGHNPPSPWQAEDAFMAVALKLAANGATRGDTPAQKRRAQWEAAMTYFAGSNWRKPGVAQNIGWYGDRALETADAFAKVIGD